MGKRLAIEPGQVFGRLTVVGFSYTNKRRETCWGCRCECGKEKAIRAGALVSGRTKSCGCLQRQAAAANTSLKLTPGQKFGRLTIVEYDHTNERGNKCWRCLCDCGKTVVAISSCLASGHTKSCGCFGRQMANEGRAVKLVSGQIFGRLTVVEFAYSKKKQRYWKCNCECGQVIITPASRLMNGGTQSCGCLQRQRASEANLLDLTPGQVFGKLTILEYDHTSKHNHRYWKCLCDCGNSKVLSVSEVMSGKVKSCGCLKSQPEIDLRAYVQSLGFLDACCTQKVIKNEAGNRLELDVYVESKKIAFEYCGLYWHGQIQNGTAARTKHLKKLEACTAAGITLITIFADEWLSRNEIVKDRIAALLGLNHISIGARKCEVREIPNDVARDFSDKYHLQGGCGATKSFGLYYQNDLIAVGMFKKSYSSYKAKADPAVWDLVRYTLKSGLRVQGGLTRIMSHFKKLTPLCTKIISFADRRWSRRRSSPAGRTTTTERNSCSIRTAMNNRVTYQEHQHGASQTR